MNDGFSPNFVTLTDEDGNEFELEHLDTMEYQGQTYLAFFPVLDQEPDSDFDDGEDYGLIILKAVEENGEEFLSTPDSAEEAEEVYQKFMESLFQEDDED